MKINSYYFNKLKENNIPTHFIRVNNDDNSMIVKKAQICLLYTSPLFLNLEFVIIEISADFFDTKHAVQAYKT